MKLFLVFTLESCYEDPPVCFVLADTLDTAKDKVVKNGYTIASEHIREEYRQYQKTPNLRCPSTGHFVYLEEVRPNLFLF
jgi:hypothetical protein